MSARRVWWVVAFLLFFSATSSEAQRRRYVVESIDVDAAVGADGVMQIEEALTYRFRGNYRYGFREIPPYYHNPYGETLFMEKDLNE